MLPFEKINRTVLTKIDAQTSPKFGKRPQERTVEEILNYGIVNVDKPEGPTSHQISAYVKQILHQKKAGHSGTLDPPVTGCLPTAIGRGTKVVQVLLTAGKEYVAIMHLHGDVPEAKIRKTMEEFVGKITQLPPVRSAVKREYRQRNIYYATILEVDGRDVLFKVGCEAGTYIRRLCEDVGKKLGVGGHMLELRRTKAGPFDEKTLVILQDVADAYWYYKNQNNYKYLKSIIQPIERATDHLAKIWVMDTTVDSMAHGAILHVPGVAKVESGIQKEDLVAVMTLKGELVAYGRSVLTSEEIMEKEKGVVMHPLRVFMETGVYPKVEREKA